MTLDAIRVKLAAALGSASGVIVTPDHPPKPAAYPVETCAALGFKAVTLKPLCFGEGLAGGATARLRLADIVLSLDIRAATAADCLTALNNLSVAAMTTAVDGVATPELSADGAVPVGRGEGFSLAAELKTSAILALEPQAEAEIVNLNLSAKLTI